MSQFKVDWKEYTHTHTQTHKSPRPTHTHNTHGNVCDVFELTLNGFLGQQKIRVYPIGNELALSTTSIQTHTHKRHFVWNNQSVVKALPSLENGDGSKRDNVWKTTHTSVGTFSSSSSQTWRSIAEHQKSKNIHSCFFFLSCRRFHVVCISQKERSH